jgi:hypothetical protein
MNPLYIVLVAQGRFRVLERQLETMQSVPGWLEIANEAAPLAGNAYTDRETDQAGRFPKSIGQAGMSIDERLPMKEEEQRRLADWVAGCIENFMTPRPGEAWVFAAGPELHNPVLEALRPSIRETLAESLQQNLINMPAAEAAGHFTRTAATKRD